MSRLNRTLGGLGRCFGWMLLLAFLPCAAMAQEGFTWEYTPYKIEVWLTGEGSAAASESQREELAAKLAVFFEIAGFSEWTAEVKWLPPQAAWAPGEPLENLSASRMREISKDILTADKLYLVQLEESLPLQVSVAEFDLHLRNWSDVETVAVENEMLLPDAIFRLIERAFRPILLLENPHEGIIWGRPRSSRLALRPDSPILIKEGAILAPATRYNDRTGEPLAKDGIVPAEWTRLKVRQVKGDRVLCDIYSGLRNPLRKRMGVRSDRYALVVKPRFPATTLEVVKRSEEAEPLIDYEVYDKPFSLEEEPKLIGRTDFLGRIDVPAEPTASLKLLYVKCGNQLLARLPIVPGETRNAVVPIGDDELRLQAEGFILGMQAATMDAYARRLEMTARFKRRLEAGEFDKAQAMIEETRRLPNRAQLMQALDQRESTFTTTNPRVQKRIDYLFGEGRKLLNSYPAEDLTSQFVAELAKARAGGGATSSASN